MCSGSVTVFLHPAQACSTLVVSLMFGDGVSDSGVNVFGSNIMQTHVPERQPSGHPRCSGPSWPVGKELEITVP
ncbi:MAG: hypothetical protein ACK55Z_23850, partial [bacterium]